MTKDEIMTRCRKVAIRIEGNKIFGDPQNPYHRIHIFRNRELAERDMLSNRSTTTTFDNPNDKQSICEFYLVPASRIDGTQPVAKK